jgi:hypothetical protein
MPKVKTETRGYGPSSHRYDYHVNAGGQFSCKLPEYVSKTLGYDTVKANTLAECEKKVNQALKDNSEAGTERRKVVLYGFACHMHIWKDGKLVFSNGHTGCQAGPRTKTIPFADGCAVQLWASAATEVKITVASKTSYSYEFLSSTIPSGASPNNHGHDFHHNDRIFPELLPWTQEREDFFARMVRGLEAVAVQLAQLSNPVAALQIADTGQFQALLEAPKTTPNSSNQTTS